VNRVLVATVALVLAGVGQAHAEEPVPPDAEPAPAPEPPPPPEPPARMPAPIIAPAPEPVPPRFAPWPTSRLAFELELYSQARWTNRAGEDLSELRLDRGELGSRVELGTNAAAELRIEAIRSAVEGGSLGVDGDSTIVRLRTAQVLGTYALRRTADHREPFVRLDGAMGFVPDPWIQLLEDGYSLKPLSRTASERLLGWPTSDLSALARATIGPARLSVAVGNGEGVRFPERNTGKTTTAVLEIVPLRTRELQLTVAATFRDGSIGVASIRDRRVGAAATLVTPVIRFGGEAVRAWGIGDRAEAEGLAVAGWADGRVVERVFVAARGATLGFEGGGRTSTFGGAIAVEPWREHRDGRSRGRLRLWLAVDRVTSSGAAMPLPGADAGDATLVMLIASAIAPFTVN